MKHRLILTILFALVFFCTQAQTVQQMDLADLLNYALQNNSDLKEAKFRKEISELTVRETKSNGLPQLEASLEYKDYLKLPTMILPGALAGTDQDIIAQFGKKYNLDADIQVSQLLFSLEYINGVRTAKKAAEIRELEVDRSEIELYQLITTEYYNLLAIYKNLEIIQNNMESLKLTRQNLEATVKGGLALQTELDRVDINLYNLEASKEKIISGIQIQTNNIKYVVGMDSETKLQIDTTGFMHLFDDHLQLGKHNAGQFIPENLIEIQLLDKNIELKDYQIKTAKAGATPTIALFGSYMYQAQREKFNFQNFDEKWFKVNVIGVKTTIPIFNGFANRTKIASAKIDKKLTVTQRRKSAEGLNLQYQNSLMNYQSNIKNCRIQQRNIKLAKRVEQQENLKFQEGISTLTDYLIAVSDYRNSQINFVQSFIDMKKSEIELMKNQGVLRATINENLNR